MEIQRPRIKNCSEKNSLLSISDEIANSLQAKHIFFTSLSYKIKITKDIPERRKLNCIEEQDEAEGMYGYVYV